MSDNVCNPKLEQMAWSYSAVTMFHDCPYRFFLRYLTDCESKDMFYASYGTYMHKLIESYYRGFVKAEDLQETFIAGFSGQVRGTRPSADIVSNYISMGASYLSSFTKFPYEMVAVEERVNFDVDGINAVGVIDFIGKDGDDLVIIDNKSRKLKPRSRRKKATQSDAELDKMLRQLYLYAEAVKQKYGKYPTKLCFNCFNAGILIEEPFIEEKCIAAKEWFKNSVSEVKETKEFYPIMEFFPCTFICDYQDECCYFESMNDERRRSRK